MAARHIARETSSVEMQLTYAECREIVTELAARGISFEELVERALREERDEWFWRILMRSVLVAARIEAQHAAPEDYRGTVH